MKSIKQKSNLFASVAPIHVRSSRMKAPLLQDLRLKYGIPSARVRKGDSAKIMRGEYKGVEGKITGIFPESGRVTVEGVSKEKVAGGNAPVQIHASNIALTALDLGDPWRKKKINESD